MKVLGLSAYFHDASAALVVDGEIVAAAAEERFTGLKHDPRLPTRAAQFCLEKAGLEITDIDHVVFYEKPLRKFERILVSQLRSFPRGLPQFTSAVGKWLGSRLWMKGDVCREIGCTTEQLLFSEHHLSHAASAYLTSPFQDSAIITVDGVGEWATTAIYRASTEEGRTVFEPLRELHYPHSIGLLYSAITAHLGFPVNEGEFRVMGLAPYGQPRFASQFEKLGKINADGSLELDMSYFAYHRTTDQSFTPKLEKLLGPARQRDEALLGDGPDEGSRFADIAASLQQFTEQYLLTLAGVAWSLTGSKNLCLAGGVALNCVANHAIATYGPFENLFVPPAAGDAGGALGAALYVSHVVGGDPRAKPLESAGLGESFSTESIHELLDELNIPHETYADFDQLLEDISKDLAREQVGGWFQGGFEWGARALGHRSILADPRGPGTKERVNSRIKFREPFRPFAPAVLSEDLGNWFESAPEGHMRARDENLLPFMCTTLPALPEAVQQLPAVVHVDGTSRVQSVSAQGNPRLHQLLQRFKDQTGVGVLLNTSMNLKDEPICRSPIEAYGVFARSDLDFLVLENCVIRRAGIEQ